MYVLPAIVYDLNILTNVLGRRNIFHFFFLSFSPASTCGEAYPAIIVVK